MLAAFTNTMTTLSTGSPKIGIYVCTLSPVLPRFHILLMADGWCACTAFFQYGRMKDLRPLFTAGHRGGMTAGQGRGRVHPSSG